ncbi:MAG: MFS transporter [Paludibacter sp.]|nr:MFS transporter [Paludibacter sp.]
MSTNQDKLWTASFINACIGNFLLFFAFYSLVPVFPIYLIEKYDASKTNVGLILSSYTLAALLIRPLAGFVLDLLYRKPLYLGAFFLFVITFVGYPLANAIGMFLFVRILHGFSFGFVTTAGNSVIVDIMPASRRGEGLGYFGIANTMAMSIGPMMGLYLHDIYNFDVVFYTAIGTGIIGFIFASSIKVENHSGENKHQPLAFDRFFLFKGFFAGICLMLMGIPYGMVITYIALYGKEIGITSSIGAFFTFMAIGLAMSRIFSGKMVDKGKMRLVISIGTFLAAISYFALSGIKIVENTTAIFILFYTISFFLGVGYGMLFPAYNALFVNLAPNNRRATASSTYMTSWDIGVGIGLVGGGVLADRFGGLKTSYFVGASAAVLSLLYFIKVAGPHFDKYKLR